MNNDPSKTIFPPSLWRKDQPLSWTDGNGEAHVVAYLGSDTVVGFHWVLNKNGYPIRVHTDNLRPTREETP